MSGCGGCCGCLGPCIVDYEDAEIAKQYGNHPHYEPPSYLPITCEHGKTSGHRYGGDAAGMACWCPGPRSDSSDAEAKDPRKTEEHR
jgi:hypothetical protein